MPLREKMLVLYQWGKQQEHQPQILTQSSSNLAIVTSRSSEFNANSSGLGKYNFTHPWSRTSRELSMIHKHLRKLNKPAIKSIQSPDGDIIDCIHRHIQPAFDHPLLKNHKIKDLPKRPSRFPGRVNGTSFSSVHAAQTWHLSGYCPEGTIPHAIAQVKGAEYYGTKASINVWSPMIETMVEFSLAQIWVVSGTYDGGDLNTIEVGWQVYPEFYGDSRPRLFIYWPTDAYRETGCYNLLCSGFVQISNKIAIGGVMSPVSEFSGKQYEITFVIWKDPKDGNGWLQYGDNTFLGYWPSEPFTHLADHATLAVWGGEVINLEPGGKHTFTTMGSGHFPHEGFGRESCIRNIELVDASDLLVPCLL